ncbi:MAG: hypothetical protein IPN02_14410 [Candidatus Microthrix sp.]|uniref:Uncharacterized protein n=1 Tax=Candidatus Neomicrothrix subdominans TaxID=2954438 RepID=A0A936NCW4_9ACTN|nr:hypothetical protein [Candidatus Microthrix subdominans]
MLAHVSDPSIDYLIVHKVDRLAAADPATSPSTWRSSCRGAAGVVFENIDGAPSGMLLRHRSSIAEFYSRNLASGHQEIGPESQSWWDDQRRPLWLWQMSEGGQRPGSPSGRHRPAALGR